jgi:hypothetical protein
MFPDDGFTTPWASTTISSPSADLAGLKYLAIKTRGQTTANEIVGTFEDVNFWNDVDSASP